MVRSNAWRTGHLARQRLLLVDGGWWHPEFSGGLDHLGCAGARVTAARDEALCIAETDPHKTHESLVVTTMAARDRLPFDRPAEGTLPASKIILGFSLTRAFDLAIPTAGRRTASIAFFVSLNHIL